MQNVGFLMMRLRYIMKVSTFVHFFHTKKVLFMKILIVYRFQNNHTLQNLLKIYNTCTVISKHYCKFGKCLPIFENSKFSLKKCVHDVLRMHGYPLPNSRTHLQICKIKYIKISGCSVSSKLGIYAFSYGRNG